MPGTVTKPKETKNQKRRAAKKAKKQEVNILYASLVSVVKRTQQVHSDAQPNGDESAAVPKSDPSEEAKESTSQIPLEFAEISEDDPLYLQFKSILDKFQDPDKEDPALKPPDKPEVYYDDDDDIPDEEADKQPKMSKKKLKERNKLSIAELKAMVGKPDLVEWTDVDAQDPRLLLALKAHRNIVPVPSHWSLKREYLSSKRGVEKPAFALPKFISDTGIAEMRDAVLEKMDQASLKQKQRERVQPKMGKLDIDYTKLYEAFFRFQTKPELTRYGEVYYEGKEYETNLKHLRPGELSDELKAALGMTPGLPPPWLTAQQHYGPPPSYPSLKIPGVNAPIPPGASWGIGQWGRPPLDELHRPLWGGDVYGIIQRPQEQHPGEPIEKSLWGELEIQEESEEEEEEEEDEIEQDEIDADDEAMAAGIQTGVRTTTGTASVEPSLYGGTDTVQGDFKLRKERRGNGNRRGCSPKICWSRNPRTRSKNIRILRQR